jgi:hypothetical protein
VGAGDVDFLMGLEGLSGQVKADLGRITGANAGLAARFDQMRASHEIKQLVWTIFDTAIQVGLLFVPGGQVLSAALGFVSLAGAMGELLQEWDVSKAAVDPTTALVDQQKAEEKLAFDTVMLVLQAVDLASSTNRALEEMGEAGKAATKALEGKIGEVAGEAVGSASRVKVTKAGQIFSCHNPCQILYDKFAEIFSKDKRFAQQLAGLEARALKAGGEKAAAEEIAREAEALEERILDEYPQYDPEFMRREAARRKAVADNPEQKLPGPDEPLPAETREQFLVRGGTITQLESIIHDHHMLPREFRADFEAAGLNIDDPQFMVRLGEQEHLKGVHGGAPRGGLWNLVWEQFLANRRPITPAAKPEILQQLAIMRKMWGI